MQPRVCICIYKTLNNLNNPTPPASSNHNLPVNYSHPLQRKGIVYNLKCFTTAHQYNKCITYMVYSDLYWYKHCINLQDLYIPFLEQILHWPTISIKPPTQKKIMYSIQDLYIPSLVETMNSFFYIYTVPSSTNTIFIYNIYTAPPQYKRCIYLYRTKI